MQSLKDRVLDRPNSEEFSLYIKPWCDNMWFDLGVLLDVPLHTLKHIKLSGSKDCCIQMFIEWLNSNSDATWDHLLKAVNNVLFGTLSDLINAYHGQKTPELAEVTQFVTPNYAAHWRTIGIQLRVPCGKLDAIEQEYPTRATWCCDRMLEIWLEGDENASWQQLVTTIIRFNRIRAFNKKGFEKPTAKECVLLVKPEYMNVWFELGTLLNMPDKRLQDIKLLDQNDSDLCCTRMFIEWENSLNPTWSQLKAAVDYLHISVIKNIADRPKLSEALNFVIPQHASQWKDIGLQLGLQTGILEGIEVAFPTNCNWCCERMLQKWLEVTIDATWKQLFDSVGHNHKSNIPDIIQPTIEHLQAEYKEARYVSSKDDWPPDQPKHFTSVALIQYKEKSSKQDTENVLTLSREGVKSFINFKPANSNYASVNFTKTSKQTKDIAEIFKPVESTTYTIPKTILIEGTPGIGKTVLCKEIAYQWATKQILVDKSLLFLLMLRNPGVQKLKSLFELVEYCCRNRSASQALEQYLYDTQGSNLVIILDGYDEISEAMREHSLIADIIDRKVLPKRTLVISSRPLCTAQLHNNMDCRVEILGLTNSDRQKFIQESLRDVPEKIPVLQKYLNENSIISTFCYIPLIMTILLCLFKASIKLPETQTELYQKFICHTIIHFLKKSGSLSYPIKSVRSLSNLEQPYKDTIEKLAKVSFTLLAEDKIVFTADDIRRICPNLNISSKGCIELGLLRVTQHFDIEETDPVVSYNFLHLSIQEFLAAWHISSLSFLQQKEILQRAFWSPRYFNVWIIYMGLTKGKTTAFQYFLGGSITNFVYNRYARNFIISNHILVEKVKCLHLFQCFVEAKNDSMCTIVGSFFKDLIIDLSSQTLLPKDVNILCFYLLRSKNSEWHKLDLSGCNIGDMGCSIMHKSLIIGDKDNNIFLQVLNLSSNHLTSNSAVAIIDLVQSFKVVELNISDNPLQNLPLESLYKCRHLKSLITGNEKYSDDSGTKSTIKSITDHSSLQFVSIKGGNGSSLIFNKGDFRIISFSSSYSYMYCNFIMRNCKITKTTSKDLSEFLILQNTLKYICICNNNFDESALLSICSTLIEKSCLQEVVISENSLSSFTIDKIATMLTGIIDCSVMVYSQYELKTINVLAIQVTELLAEQPGLIRLKIVNCKQTNDDLVNVKNIPNSIEVFNFYTNEPDGIACFAKAFNYAFLKNLHINKANISDDAANDIVKTLSCNRTLTEFNISYSTLSTEAAKKILGTLANISTLKIFSICNCGISDEVATNIAFGLRNNCTALTKVDISKNKLNSDASIKIFKALKSCHNLETFKINGNKISDEAAENIIDILHNNPCLAEVDVTLNQFTPTIGRNIVTVLKNNTSLKIFNIGNCRITEEVANEIASIIPGLEELDLSGSHLTSVGAHKIVQALTDSKNLRIFKASKHMITKNTVNKVVSLLSHNPELVHLDVSSNFLMFGATKFIRSLHNKPLEVLKMSNCKITKTVAHEIGDILKTAPLVELDLSDNPALTMIGATMISRSLRSTVLETLQVLNLRKCGITENACKEFILALSTLTKLRELDISYNQFTPDSIFRLFEALHYTQIQILKLNGCKTAWSKKEQREFFPNKTKLFHLELSGTDFPISGILKYTSTLLIVDISRCLYVNDEEAKSLSDGISNNPSLQKLDISYNDLTTSGANQIVRALQDLRTLQSFAINNCKIRDNAGRYIAAAISLNPQLVELNISWNALTGIGTTSIIQSLTNISHLQVLKAAGCGLTEREADELASVLSDKASLKELDLSWNELKTEGINVVINGLCSIISLEVLKIDNCNITDKAANLIATNLAKHHALTELDISHNDFTPTGVSMVVKSLKALSNLTVLKISNCILDEGSSTDIGDAISNNGGLSHFELYHSHFTTTGATLFCQKISNRVHILQTLKLVNCSITDKESPEIAAILTSNEMIEHLDLSHNPLGEGVTGIIQVLQTNKVIEELILQSCAITDEVACNIASVAKSTTLREFNILHNQLTNDGAFIIAKGFMDSTTLKILKIKDWSEPSQHENYVLSTLQRNKVSLNLE